MSIYLWITKIANFIQAGSPFREAYGRANRFKMLPQWWQLMEEEKREELHEVVYIASTRRDSTHLGVSLCIRK
jgi:hypothetical protein